ncbi:hypothetical protein Ocin01_00756 [Orchesella cincta]|uniref:Uncharacterized protein n=1 Tax=Orchesella cincta TaxID=48709 RepID=A0A1D2NL09_ORCCI|nr:hypothetical protein Ocin01_00756 [Orchesella cincta]
MIDRNMWHMKFLTLFTVLQFSQGHENGVLSKALGMGNMRQTFSPELLSSPREVTANDDPLGFSRYRRQTAPGPPNFNFDDDSRDSQPFIPRIEPPPPGSILTFDGKPISTSIGAYSIVPKSERRTPSISRNRPQYATYRGDLPPPIPDTVPLDLPQFKKS